MPVVSRRQLLAGTSACGAITIMEGNMPAKADDEHYDLSKQLQGWQTVAGNWTTEKVTGAINGQALVQRAVNNEFNVVVAPGGPYRNISASVRFKPMAGREDASGGIVFRFSEGRYYVIRANALEDNFRLYYYDAGRRMIATATTKPPALGEWHALRIAAKADRIQGWLNGRMLIDHRDSRFAAGRVGLWTKADSITAFDELVIRAAD